MNGMLYVVSTPIGNLEDISLRALRILKTVDFILAEDTRQSKILLRHHQIGTQIFSYHEHNERKKIPWIIGKLSAGKNAVLISDAGTPLVSDPGFLLVRAAAQKNIQIVPIPGPSAFLAALSASMLAAGRFTFCGFLPNRQSPRRRELSMLKARPEVLIFYESPRRVVGFLNDVLEIFGDREATLAREMTKSFEKIITARTSALLEYLDADKNHRRGEFVILVAGADDADFNFNLEKILPILKTEMSAAKAARIAAKIIGTDKKICYKKIISS